MAGPGGTGRARVVLLALGVANRALMPQLPARIEKRQLFVLDLPVVDRAGLPHIVVPLDRGYAYLFVKELDGRLRLLVGQEEIVADDRCDAAGREPFSFETCCWCG